MWFVGDCRVNKVFCIKGIFIIVWFCGGVKLIVLVILVICFVVGKRVVCNVVGLLGEIIKCFFVWIDLVMGKRCRVFMVFVGNDW